MKILGALASIITIITGIYVIMDRMGGSGKHYGAISYTATGVYGSSWEQVSIDLAKSAASRDCRAQSKGKSCKTKLIQDKECAALGRSSKKKLQISAIGLGNSSAAAKSAALKGCDKKIKKSGKKGSCAIVTSLCADGRHS